MKVKRFVAPSMQVGLKLVGETLGPGAVILSNRRLADGLEIVAGVDESDLADYQASQPAPEDRDAIIKARPKPAADTSDSKLDKQSMQELLQALAPKNQAAFGAHRPAAKAKPEPLVPAVKQQPERPVLAVSRVADTGLQSKDANSEAGSELMRVMRQEIAGLRTLLEQQTDVLREPKVEMSPRVERLEARLQSLGFSASVQRSLLRHYKADVPLDTNWRRLMGRLTAGLATPLFDPLEQGGVLAFCGPTGAGKTTTLAKLAARYVKDNDQDSLAIVTTDFYQMGAQASLASVSRILGVKFIALQEGDSLADTLKRLASKRLVLVDTSGSREAMRQWQRDVIDSGLEARLSTLMVIPATAHGDSIKQFIAAFPGRSISGAVITKLDEAPCFGSLFDSLLRYRWPIWYCSAGQNIPRDLEPCEPAELVKRLMRGLRETPAMMARAG